MKRITLGLSAAMVLTWAIYGIAAPNSAPQPAATNDHLLRIGVVDTTQLLRSMQETKKLEQTFRDKNTQLLQEQQRREAQIQEAQKHRDTQILPGSAQWDKETADNDKARAELAVWKESSSVQLERWYKKSLKGVFDHVAAATARVAEQQHLDLVIAEQNPEIGPDLDKVSVQQLQMALAANAVLYKNKKANITEDVLTMLEAEYANQQKVGAVSLKPGDH